VRLIDDEAGYPRLGEAVEEARTREPLRCHVEELEAAQPRHPQRLQLVGAGERGVDVGRLDMELAEAIDLVFHKRDERRDDDREPVPEECRDPVADRLTGSRRGDGEHVPAGQLGLHHLDLAGAEGL